MITARDVTTGGGLRKGGYRSSSRSLIPVCSDATLGAILGFTNPKPGEYLRQMTLRDRIFAPFLKAAPLVLLVAGCAREPASPVRPPEEFEKETFQAISTFYCEYKRWPNDWKEFKDFLDSIGKGDSLGEDYRGATLESPRAILVTLNYDTLLGSPSRVSFIAPPQCEPPANPKDTLMCGGRISLRLPPEFSVMGGVAVKERWRAPPYPDAAWRSKSGGYVVALRFWEVMVEPGAIEQFKETWEASYETSIPGLTWVVREVVEQDGRTFLAHEFESDTSRGRTVTVVVSTSFDGKLFSVNIAGPIEGRTQVEAYAREIMHSLKLR